MTQFIKQNRWQFFVGGFACGLLVFALVAFRANGREQSLPTREVTLVARANAFNETNPDVVLKVGQPVRLVVRNEEGGRTLHCFRIPSLDVKTSANLAKGESEILTFTPKKRGMFAYTCLMHPAMTGKLIVE